MRMSYSRSQLPGIIGAVNVRPNVDMCLVTEDCFKLAELQQHFEQTAWGVFTDNVNSQLASDPQWIFVTCGTVEAMLCPSLGQVGGCSVTWL